ncbi:MAG: hypothetical protein S4CHLAM45_02960 [Chlamydiales bacterium]|nr:hypothetical protein [Chlamydiales bacterium]MCH9619154.1 hypothetical protein [Chlamydiales bacterium]MCH9622416.1 hypothetical protein [Chlamydiales bacterium]
MSSVCKNDLSHLVKNWEKIVSEYGKDAETLNLPPHIRSKLIHIIAEVSQRISSMDQKGRKGLVTDPAYKKYFDHFRPSSSNYIG